MAHRALMAHTFPTEIWVQGDLLRVFFETAGSGDRKARCSNN